MGIMGLMGTSPPIQPQSTIMIPTMLMPLVLTLLAPLITQTQSIAVRSPPGAIIIKRLVQLKEHSSDDLHRSDIAWEESSTMCMKATDLLRKEAKQALLNEKALETKCVFVQNKFNKTHASVRKKRLDVLAVDEKINAIVNGNLKDAKMKLSSATSKLAKAIEVARPENSRLTLAIEKTDRVIESIKLNTQKATGNDVQEAANNNTTTLLEIIPEAEDVGPRFVAAIVKLNDLKIALEVLRNNSMEVFTLKVKHAESQMKYANEKMIKIVVELNVTKVKLQATRNSIETMENELVNLTKWEATLNEKLVVAKDNFRRAEVAAEQTSKYCKSAHDDYKEVSFSLVVLCSSLIV
jgi:hypothetical protein